MTTSIWEEIADVLAHEETIGLNLDTEEKQLRHSCELAEPSWGSLCLGI